MRARYNTSGFLAAAALAVGVVWSAVAKSDPVDAPRPQPSAGTGLTDDAQHARERALGIVAAPPPPPPVKSAEPATLADALKLIAKSTPPAEKPAEKPAEPAAEPPPPPREPARSFAGTASASAGGGVAISTMVPAPRVDVIPTVDPDSGPPEARIVPTGCKCAQPGGPISDVLTAPDFGPLQLGPGGPGGPGPACSSCGGGGQCVPGQKPCYPCESDHAVGRYLCGIYECLCCQDHCYEPRWLPLTDSAFFVDAARPQTTTRFRYDAGRGLTKPDRSEYFWARADGNGKGPRPARPETQLRYDDFMMYTEGATGAAGAFVEVPYRSYYSDVFGHSAGFNDMTIGTKALLFDCELLLLTFEFKTFLPIGNFTKGIGVGHVSLEPSLLAAVKLGPTTYMQAQLSEWIPIAGDPDYAGAVFHHHVSINQQICKILPNVPLIGTFEYNGYSFQDGAYTDPIRGTQQSSGKTYVSVGPGLRLFVCDKIDIGFGSAFSLTADSFGRQIYRTEFRVRF